MRNINRNKNLKANLAYYQMFSNIYKGGRFVKDPDRGTLDPSKRDGSTLIDGSYLERFPNESDEAFSMRIRRSKYRNFSRDVVRVNVATIFEQGNSIDRREVSEDLGPIAENIDGRGSSLQSFIRRATVETFIFGWIGVLTDYPVFDQSKIVSIKDENENNIRPASKIILPIDIWDWYQDPNTQRFEYILVNEGLMKTQDGPVQVFREIEPDRWSVVAINGDVIDSGYHDYGNDLPFDICVCDRASEDSDLEPFGYSCLADVADLQIENYNLSSQLQDLIAKVNFPILHVQGPPGKSKGTRRKLPVGPDYALYSESPVAWVSPDVMAIQKTRELLDRNESEIREIAGIATRSEESTEAHSGAALRWEYSTKLSLIKDRAENLRQFEQKLYRRYQMVLDRDIRYWSIKYPTDYATQPVPQEFDELKTMLELGVPKSIARSQLKGIVLKNFYHLSDLDDLISTIDSWLEPGEEVDDKTSEKIDSSMRLIEQLVKAKAPNELVRVLLTDVARILGIDTPQVISSISSADFR